MNGLESTVQKSPSPILNANQIRDWILHIRPCSGSALPEEGPAPPAAAAAFPVDAFLFSVEELGVVVVDDDEAVSDPDRVRLGGLEVLGVPGDDVDDGEDAEGAFCGEISFRQ